MFKTKTQGSVKKDVNSDKLFSSQHFSFHKKLHKIHEKNKRWNYIIDPTDISIGAKNSLDVVKNNLKFSHSHERKDPVNEIKHKLFDTSAAILSTHIIRKCMYDSLDYKTPQATVINTYKSWLNGIHYNWARGTSAVFLQWLVKDEVEKRAGWTAGVFAAGFLGMLAALTFETSLIYGSKKFIFNPYLAGLYLTRETLFISIAFANQDQSNFVKYPNLIMATFLTAGVQNLLVSDIRRPTFKPGIKAFNLRDSISTIRGMAQREYTHPCDQAKYKNPTTFLMQMYNMGTSFCSPNSFFWRGLYLVAFPLALQYAPKVRNAVTEYTSNFFTTPKKVTPVMVNTEKYEKSSDTEDYLTPRTGR